MVWSYGGFTASGKDYVRFLVGDTDSAEQLVQDQEIDAILTLREGNEAKAAVDIAESILMRLSRVPDESYGGYSGKYGERAKTYAEQVKRLRLLAYGSATATGAVVTPFSGGSTESGKETYERNTDRVRPSFKRGQFDHWGSVTSRDYDETPLVE